MQKHYLHSIWMGFGKTELVDYASTSQCLDNDPACTRTP